METVIIGFVTAALGKMAAVADQRKRFAQIKLAFAKRLAHHLNNLFIHQVSEMLCHLVCDSSSLLSV